MSMKFGISADVLRVVFKAKYIWILPRITNELLAHTDTPFYTLRGLESVNITGGEHDNIMVCKFKV